MDDLLDDDKDLFGDIKTDDKESATVTVVAPGKEKLEDEAKKAKSGGGLFDDLPLDDGAGEPLSKSDGQASNINGYKGTCKYNMYTYMWLYSCICWGIRLGTVSPTMY